MSEGLYTLCNSPGNQARRPCCHEIYRRFFISVVPSSGIVIARQVLLGQVCVAHDDDSPWLNNHIIAYLKDNVKSLQRVEI